MRGVERRADRQNAVVLKVHSGLLVHYGSRPRARCAGSVADSLAVNTAAYRAR